MTVSKNMVQLIDDAYACVVAGKTPSDATLINDIIQLHHLVHHHQSGHQHASGHSSNPLADEMRQRILSNINIHKK